jgi:hypothetical protein
MAMVEYLANSTPCPLGNFPCSFGRANTHVLAGNRRALAHVPRSINWMERDEIAGTFTDAFGRRSCAFGGSLADVSGATADVATQAPLLRSLLNRRLGCLGCRLRRVARLRRGLLAVLPCSVVAADSEAQCKQRNG